MLDVLAENALLIAGLEIVPSDDEPLIDFDAVYARFRDETRLPELFDKLIATLQSVIDSGEVDSVMILKSLEELVSTLRANRKGSGLAINGAMYVATMVKNISIGTLKEITPLKVLIEAWEKTQSEMEAAVKRTEAHVFDETVGAMRRVIPKLPAPTNHAALQLAAPETAVAERSQLETQQSGTT